MVLGQKHIPQPELLGFGLEFFDDGGVRAPSLGVAFADLFEVRGVGGDAFFFDEFFDLLVAVLD